MESKDQIEDSIVFSLRRAARLSLTAFIIAAFAAINVNAQQSTSRKQSSKPAQVKVSKQVSMTASDIREAEQLLSDLGYWTGTIDGRMDVASRDALIAFQKVEGRQTTGKLTRLEIEALRNATRPLPLESGYAHVEADLGRQVLFVVDTSGKVTNILPISSGNGEEFTSEGWTRRAVTPTGRFKVYRKVEGWRKAPLGNIYYPNYFLSGVAIHGSQSVPTRPASHGCIRIPLFAAKEFSEIISTGTVVIVHDGAAVAQGRKNSSLHERIPSAQQR
jgi:lipoprotein-anchoring transpeptidase ErfK/SrfK